MADPYALDDVPFDFLFSNIFQSSADPDAPPHVAAPHAAPDAPPRALAPAPPKALLLDAVAAAAPQLALAAAHGAAADAPSFGGGQRCLDASHGAGCDACLPPPLEGEEGLYELAGDPALKNGEKKLRSLLARCPEWSSDDARLRLADALEAAPGAEDRTRLVSCLRGTDTMAALRKVDLIALARGWGYRCSLWRRRRACSRVTQRALATLRSSRGEGAAAVAVAVATPVSPAVSPQAFAAAAASSLLPLEPFDSRGATSAVVSAYISARLVPLGAEAARLFRGDDARDAAVVHGWAHVTPSSCDEVRKVSAYLSGGQPRWAAMLANVTTLHATLPANEVAFRALAGHEAALLPLDALVTQMGTVLNRSVAAEAARRTDAATPPAEAAWLDELHRGRLMALEVCARCQSLLINAKFGATAEYLEVCAHVLRLLIGFFHAIGAAFEAREAWMRRLLAIDAGAGGSALGVSGREAAPPIYKSPLQSPDDLPMLGAAAN